MSKGLTPPSINVILLDNNLHGNAVILTGSKSSVNQNNVQNKLLYYPIIDKGIQEIIDIFFKNY